MPWIELPRLSMAAAGLRICSCRIAQVLQLPSAPFSAPLLSPRTSSLRRASPPEVARVSLQSLCPSFSLSPSSLRRCLPLFRLGRRGPALIVVGAMMMRGLVKINWEDYQESIPAFVTIALMPLTYSIAYGIIAGLFTWVVIKLADMALDAIFQKVESKGRTAIVLRRSARDASARCGRADACDDVDACG